jgi:hypothetical protein
VRGRGVGKPESPEVRKIGRSLKSEEENNSEIENGEALNEVNPASEINPK